MFAARAMPLYPEQNGFRAALPRSVDRRWISDVCRSFAGAAGPELRSVIETARAVRHQPMPAAAVTGRPVALLTSRAYGQRWAAMQRGVAATIAARTHHITDDRSHNIHLRHPELVAATILELMTAARPTVS